MSNYITGPDVVKYACSCGLLKPITRLYFCRHCLELRCGFCVCHEVDSNYCGKCCENLPSAEARLKKNRCGDCYDCPSCKQNLSKRAATVGPKNPEDPKATPRKVYYLLCLNCRWSSRDVGIPDQAAATGSWPERENVHAARLQEIIEMYKGIVLAEKQQKMEKDKKKQRRFMTFTDRTGITASMLRKRIGLPDIPHPLLKPKPKEPEEAVAKEEVEEFPEELLTKPINLNEITTLEQRLNLPEWQPTTVDKLFPIHKQVSVKRSQRCRACEHNVSKPEYSPTSIKFKIQLFAFYHIPEVRIFTVEPLRAGKQCELLLKFSNPTQHQTVITFLPLFPSEDSFASKEIKELVPDEEVPSREIVIEEKQPPSLPGSQPSSLLHTSLSRTPSITVKPRPIKQAITANVELPTSNFVLLPRDDAAEFDDSGDTHNIQDDTKLVVWRKSNKAVIRLNITPLENLNIGDEVVVGFTMQHIYVNTITAVESKEPQRYNNNVKVFQYLGKIVGSE
ncbi:dynactin subunit 4 [Agrilus planipennis]|uniref:Dynactin subunit 4 n=1 Tax=Agrilus planipennis TaxID=224129 RepID=A0A1W4WQT5_AGRPL|nr:dynactin subunit 4 [Agrilus planipennis]